MTTALQKLRRDELVRELGPFLTAEEIDALLARRDLIVNKIKQQSHDLNDGDLVELGEVRLRFRANMEAVG